MNRYAMTFLLAALIFCCISTGSYAQTIYSPCENTISIYVIGRVESRPDIAILPFHVVSTKPTASNALKECSEKIKKIESILKSEKVSNVHFEGIRISAGASRFSSMENEPKGYSASCNLTFAFENIDNIQPEEIAKRISTIVDDLSGEGAIPGLYSEIG